MKQEKKQEKEREARRKLNAPYKAAQELYEHGERAWKEVMEQLTFKRERPGVYKILVNGKATAWRILKESGDYPAWVVIDDANPGHLRPYAKTLGAAKELACLAILCVHHPNR